MENIYYSDTFKDFYLQLGPESSFNLVPIEKGLKIKVMEQKLKELQEEPYIKDNFKLNIKRLNRWWYSVYFDEICNHDCEYLIFSENKFCSKCKVKL
jgi:hypothetical protein